MQPAAGDVDDLPMGSLLLGSQVGAGLAPLLDRAAARCVPEPTQLCRPIQTQPLHTPISEAKAPLLALPHAGAQSHYTVIPRLCGRTEVNKDASSFFF